MLQALSVSDEKGNYSVIYHDTMCKHAHYKQKFGDIGISVPNPYF